MLEIICVLSANKDSDALRKTDFLELDKLPQRTAGLAGWFCEGSMNFADKNSSIALLIGKVEIDN